MRSGQIHSNGVLVQAIFVAFWQFLVRFGNSKRAKEAAPALSRKGRFADPTA
jgi:hypothetical protein